VSVYAIETVGLTKRYGDSFAVNNLSLHVPRGKIYGLLGRNGAGKTTAMRMLLNLARPTSGTILLFESGHGKRSEAAYRKIGSIIETPGFYDNLTGRENLNSLARLLGDSRKGKIDRALEIVGLDKETRKLFCNYSLGMKQRLGIAGAIMHEPELLILDEPINGLDPIGIHEIRTFLRSLCRENGTTILLSSHVLNEIEQLADAIGVMHKGCLIEEVDMQELRSKYKRCAVFEVSDTNAAARLLERQFAVSDYACDGNTIKVYDGADKRGEINRCFVSNGLSVTTVKAGTQKLEDYFSGLIGGKGIA
jgi:ABC-type multidrug transport system ATPase subunit